MSLVDVFFVFFVQQKSYMVLGVILTCSMSRILFCQYRSSIVWWRTRCSLNFLSCFRRNAIRETTTIDAVWVLFSNGSRRHFYVLVIAAVLKIHIRLMYSMVLSLGWGVTYRKSLKGLCKKGLFRCANNSQPSEYPTHVFTKQEHEDNFFSQRGGFGYQCL